MSNKQKTGKSDFYVIKWIFNICRPKLLLIGFLIVIDIVYGATSVVFANFSKSVIDAATVSKETSDIIKYAAALLGVVLLQLGLSLLINSVYERCKGRLDIIFRRSMLDTVMKKNYSDVISYHTGELQNRIFNDINIVTDGVTKILPNTFFYFTKLLSSLIYLIILDKLFALVFLAGGLIVFAASQLFRKKLKSLHRRVQETEGETRSFVQEILTNLLAVKAFSVENKMQEHADKLQENNFKAKIKRRNFAIFANSGLSTVFGIGSVFAIAFGAWRILSGDMTYGTVTAIIQLVNQVQGPFASLSGIMPQYFAMIASGERLMELDSLGEESQCNASDIDRDKIYKELVSLSFENISFKYDRDLIFDNTSYEIKKGDFTAITGISGIGKSTLLKLLLGVFDTDGGSITIKTENERVPVDRHTRTLFSYVPQGNMLISGTIRDNLTFINDATEDEILNAVEISCAREFIDDLPLGLDTVIGEKGIGLSEGQIQRLAIARSLLSNAPVLLLDEATSALDEKTELRFLKNLKKMNNVTCIIVTHKKAALDICNKQIQIKNGKITEV